MPNPSSVAEKTGLVQQKLPGFWAKKALTALESTFISTRVLYNCLLWSFSGFLWSICGCWLKPHTGLACMPVWWEVAITSFSRPEQWVPLWLNGLYTLMVHNKIQNSGCFAKPQVFILLYWCYLKNLDHATAIKVNSDPISSFFPSLLLFLPIVVYLGQLLV